MKKNFLQDVVPPSHKRSIRDIPLPTNRNKTATDSDISSKSVFSNEAPPRPREDNFVNRATERPVVTKREDEEDEEMTEDNDYSGHNINNRNKRKKGMKKAFWLTGTVIVIVLVFVMLNIFSGAEVTIIPKQAESVVNETITATVSTGGSITLQNGLSYKLVEVSETASESVKATGEENVETKASGIITIFNNFTTDAQPLVKNTRFETPNGLIFRIEKSITVPGKSSDGKAGTIDVEVFADEIGEKYNIDSSNLTIPGFKDTPQFDGFSAKTKTAISGGFKGIRPVVSEEDFRTAVQNLETQLKDTLKNKATGEKGENMIALFDDTSTSFSTPKQSTESGSVNISVTGTLNLLVFDEAVFSNYLASEVLTIFNQDDDVYIADPSTLTINLLPKEESDSEGAAKIQISGKAKFVWKNDLELLKQDLAGNNKKELKNVMQDYNGIAKVEAVVRPFWKSKFPADVEKISVIEKISDKE